MRNEAKIEQLAEREMDKLDRQFMNGKLSREQYDREVTKLDKWVSFQLKGVYDETKIYKVG